MGISAEGLFGGDLFAVDDFVLGSGLAGSLVEFDQGQDFDGSGQDIGIDDICPELSRDLDAADCGGGGKLVLDWIVIIGAGSDQEHVRFDQQRPGLFSEPSPEFGFPLPGSPRMMVMVGVIL